MFFSIKIKKTDHGNLVARVDDTNLFEFRYCPETRTWCFYLSDGRRIEKPGLAFNWTYFTELCRATAFFSMGKPLWASASAKVVSGKSYLK